MVRLGWAVVVVVFMSTLSTPTTTTAKALRSAALTAYRRSYEKKGQPDAHQAVFASLPVATPKRVLYPGCHRHITASLCFSHVEYIDCDEKVSDVYKDEVVCQWVMQQWARLRSHDGNDKDESDEKPTWNFTCASFDSNLSFEQASFDLIISLSAGIVSTPCLRYLRDENGYLLVNDSHGDASAAFVNPQLKLVAVYQESNINDDDIDAGGWTMDASILQEYFVTTKQGTPLTPAQAKQAATIGVKAKRSYKLAKEAPFYLFQKQARQEVDMATRDDNKARETKRQKQS